MTEVNLLPEIRAKESRRWMLKVGVICVSVILIGWGIWRWGLPGKSPSERTEVHEVPSTIVEEGTKAAYLRSPVAPLEAISSSLPPFTWVTSVVLTSSGELSVQGVAFSPLRIWEFLERLRAFVPSAQVSLIRKGRFWGKLAFGFSIRAQVEPKVVYAKEPMEEREFRAWVDGLLRDGKGIGAKAVRWEKLGDRLKVWIRGKGKYKSVQTFLGKVVASTEPVEVPTVLLSPSLDSRPDQVQVVLTVETQLEVEDANFGGYGEGTTHPGSERKRPSHQGTGEEGPI